VECSASFQALRVQALPIAIGIGSTFFGNEKRLKIAHRTKIFPGKNKTFAPKRKPAGGVRWKNCL